MSDNLFDVKLSHKNGVLFLLVRLLYHLMHHASGIVEKGDSQGRIRIDRDLHKSSGWLGAEEGLFDHPIGVGGFRITGLDALDGVFIVESAD